MGLWAGIEVHPQFAPVRDAALRALDAGVIVKDTHATTLRLAPPLVIDEADLTTASRWSWPPSLLTPGCAGDGFGRLRPFHPVATGSCGRNWRFRSQATETDHRGQRNREGGFIMAIRPMGPPRSGSGGRQDVTEGGRR